LWLSTLVIVLGITLVVGFTAMRSASDRAESTVALTKLNDRIKQSLHWAGLIQTNVARSQAELLVTDPDMRQELEKAIAATRVEVNRVQQNIESGELSASERQQLAVIAQNLQNVRQLRDQVLKPLAATPVAAAATPDAAAPSATAATPAAASEAAAPDPMLQVRQEFNSKVMPAFDTYQKSLQDFVAMQERAYETTQANNAQRAKSLVMLGSGLMLLLVFGILLGASWLLRSIRQPLTQVNELAARIAKGDLSMQIDTRRGDEFGDLMKSLASMNTSLARMVNQVRQSTVGITSASSEIASGNNDLAQRTEQTSSNLQSTASSMVRLTQTVQVSADNARQASTLAATASSVAERGGAVVRQVVSTMEDINVSSRKIADIIGVIDGIAFQTNILALNAAVEAARAGEQGRGFAVVASEVRSLAQRSAEAAKEIKMLINTSVDKVASGTQLVSDAGVTMNDIVQSVRKVVDVIGEITAASGEQSAGISAINSAIGNLDQMSQQNAALVEQSAAAAQTLRDQADQLARAVAVFITNGSALAMMQRPPRDITPRPQQLAFKQPARLSQAPIKPALSARPVPQRLGTSANSAAPKVPAGRLALAKPAAALKSAPPRPAPVKKAAASDSDWETF
jgi:methyl-accepting chemotaxis protein